MRLRETRRFRFHVEQLGGHVRVNVWAGTARHDALPDGTETGDILGGHRAHCGAVTFRPEEWASLRRVLELGVEAHTEWEREPDFATGIGAEIEIDEGGG